MSLSGGHRIRWPPHGMGGFFFFRLQSASHIALENGRAAIVAGHDAATVRASVFPIAHSLLVGDWHDKRIRRSVSFPADRTSADASASASAGQKVGPDPRGPRRRRRHDFGPTRLLWLRVGALKGVGRLNFDWPGLAEK